MAKIREVALVAGVLTGAGGVQRLTEVYARSLIDGGYKVTVFYRGESPDWLGSKAYFGLRGVRYGGFFAIIKMAAVRRNLQWIVMPDSRARVFSALIPVSCGVYFLMDSVRFFEPKPKSFTKLLTWLVERYLVAFRVTLASYQTVFDVIASIGGDCKAVIYNPISSECMAAAKTSKAEGGSKRRKLIYMGRLEYEKGADLLPEICMELAERGSLGFDVEVWGDGSMRGALETRISGLQMPDVRVSLMGVCKSPGSVYAYADVVLLPSRTEGPSLTCAEAVSAGVPVVFFNVPGNGPNEVCGPGGYGVSAGDIKGFADAVIQASKLKSEDRLALSHFGLGRYGSQSFLATLERILQS
ncbi:MAG: glycosyltransferase [Aquabacterium sp.]|uniref:glycosyltransferase n=1 Tax=Aquabacterium sp. TaxID=1872578 RepID=UPI003BCF01CA